MHDKHLIYDTKMNCEKYITLARIEYCLPPFILSFKCFNAFRCEWNVDELTAIKYYQQEEKRRKGLIAPLKLIIYSFTWLGQHAIM